MKKIQILLVGLTALILSSCVKSNLTKTYTVFSPVYMDREQVLNNIKGGTPQTLSVPGKIYVYGDYLFVNEINKGIHIIDNSNPATPVNKSFISIPGNIDIAVKGNILYADIFTDMIALDISNPLAPRRTAHLTDVFPERSYNGFKNTDKTKFIVDWIEKDTTVDYTNGNACWNCRSMSFENSSALFSSADGQRSQSPTVGVAGSTARFSIVNNYLYLVNQSSLNVYDIKNPETPIAQGSKSLGRGIETIYPFQDKLFIGSTTGMHIYDISVPNNPGYISVFSHATMCDPVVTDGKYAYLTLRAGRGCGGDKSELDVIDVTNLSAPKLINSYPLTNPYGLGIDGNNLWVCDGSAGLKLYDASNKENLKLSQTITGISPYDVIPISGRLIVSAKEGIVQYDYTNTASIKLLSKIAILK